MSLRRTHIEKISRVVCAHFMAEHNLLVAEEAALGRISSLLTANMEAERSLEDEAHKLLDKNRKIMGADIDEQKAFMLIKRQLAKQKNFVL